MREKLETRNERNEKWEIKIKKLNKQWLIILKKQ